MIVIVPETITPSKLTSTNVEVDKTVGVTIQTWSSSATYTSIGVLVIYQNKIYENLQNPNTNKNPANEPSFWLDRGETNPYRMFNKKVSSVSTQLETIAVTLTPGVPVTGIALFNVIGASVQVIGNTPSAGNFYDQTIELQNYDNIQNPFDYFFADVSERLKSEIVFTDIPAFGGATYRIIIDNGAATAHCGELVFGRKYELGATLENAEVSIRDFSKKETDDFGDFIIVERAYRKEGSFDVMIDASRSGYVRRFFEERRAIPLVFIGSELSDDTVFYGFYQNFRSIIGNPEKARYSIMVEGLT
jgi:hypothetical protein